jgi:hypothetical protein
MRRTCKEGCSLGDAVNSTLLSYFCLVQKQAIGYDCYAAHGHGRCSQDVELRGHC